MTAQAQLETFGIRCDACPPLIEYTLERLPGVIIASADRERGLTTVLYDPSQIGVLEIADEIHRAGFGVLLRA